MKITSFSMPKTKPVQVGLHGVLGYIQTAGNLVKGDAIALLKADPFIRLYLCYNKAMCLFQIFTLNGKNQLPLPQGDDYTDVGGRVIQEKLPRAGERVETLFQSNKQGTLS